jgi:hypothetical protein
VKYALAILAMSVNDVPGWLVTMPPSGIGVPVAFTPGLVPHCDVLTAAAFDELDELGALVAGLADLLLHPATAVIPIAATTATVARIRGARPYILTCLHLLVVTE